uniref:Protein MIS12 homolog n=1 Tax=Trichuris muris TaxID=70415 RepID=A0A5S6QKB8_TRIMR
MADEQPGCSKSVGSSRSENYEYETMHFGFNPKSLMDAIYNAMFDTSMDHLAVIEQEILTLAADDNRKAAVHERVNRLRAKIEKTLDHAFDQLQSKCLKQIFRIRSHVSLPEDRVQNPPFGPVTRLEHLKACEQAKILEQKLATQRFLVNARKEELELIAHIKNTLANDAQCLYKLAFPNPDIHLCVMKLAVLIKGNSAYQFNLLHGNVVEHQCIPLNGATKFQLELQSLAKADVASSLKLVHILSCGHDTCPEKRAEQEIPNPMFDHKTLHTVLPIKYVSPEISLPCDSGKADLVTVLSSVIHCDVGTCAQWQWTMQR